MFTDDGVRLAFTIHHCTMHISLVHADQQDTPSWSNVYNRRHAYAQPWQFGLDTCTSNMPASMCQHRARHRNMAKHQVSTTDETRCQISKPKQPNRLPNVALQHCKVSCCRMHSCHTKALKHAALLKHALRCKQCTLVERNGTGYPRLNDSLNTQTSIIFMAADVA